MSAAVHDLVIRGAHVVDGSGGAGVDTDVAVDGDRIVAVGTVPGKGREELDGRGQVLAPGFIDPHTHLDANLWWDPDVTPCSSYGVTTVVTGNCGYTLAPIADASARDYVVDALCTVEQIPRAAIDESVRFRQGTLAEYFAMLDALPVVRNHATLVGHVPVRTAVLGPVAAHERAATADERVRIAALVAEGVRLGALGFSTDQVVGNDGPGGAPLPGQVCDDEELLAVAGALGAGPGPGLFTMARALLQGRAEREDDLEWHLRLAAASGRPVVVGPVFDRWSEPGVGLDLVELAVARRRPDATVVPQISTRVFELWTRLDMPGLLVRALPTLHRAVVDGGADAVRQLARDASARTRLRDEAGAVAPNLVWSGRWDHVAIRYAPRHPGVVDRSVQAVADEWGVAPTDVLLDVAIDDDFEAQFAPSMANDDDGRLGPMVGHPAAMIGASDAGAHVLSNTDSCFAVWTLQHWVRERGVLSLERAVRKLTADQADLLGFADRGRIAPGLAADLVLFDPGRVGTAGVRFVSDQPAGGRRLVTDAVGIAASVVNGVVATRDGRSTGARPGRFLRGGGAGLTNSRPVADAEGRIDAGTRLALVAMALGVFVIANDFTALSVAIPNIESDMNTSLTDAQWVINGYALVFGVLIVTGGRLADLFGRKRVFMIGAAIFATFSLGAGLAPDIELLILCRGLMAVGGAMMWPAVLGMTYALLPDSKAGLAGGLILGVAGLGNAVGPLLGGFLTDELSWEWVFFINLPITAFAVFVTWRQVPETILDSAERHIDYLGIALLSTGVVAILLALDEGPDTGFGDPVILALFAAGAVSLTAFVFVERRQGDGALVPSEVLRNRVFAASCASVLLMSALFFAALLYLPQFMENVLGYSALGSGAGLLPLMGVFAVTSFIAGSLYDRLGGRRVVVSGAASLCIGMLLLSFVEDDSGYGALVPGMIVMGLGVGLFYSAITTIAVTSLDPSQSSLAGGIVYMCQIGGGALGLGLNTAIVASGSTLADGISVAFRVDAVLAFVGLLVVLAFVGREQPAPGHVKTHPRALHHRHRAHA